MALEAYIDGSGNGTETLVLAGFIASAEKWTNFSLNWKKELKGIRTKAFKASRMHQTPTKLKKSEKFYRIIEDDVDIAFSCVVHKKDAEDAVKNINWPAFIKRTDQLANPYYFSFKAIVNILLQYAGDLKIDQPVNFYFDDQTEKLAIIDAWELLRNGSSPDVAALMGTLNYDSDENLLPLQAADFYAYWVRRWGIEGNTNGVANLEFPWKINRDIPRIDMRFSKDDLIKELSRGLDDPKIIARVLSRSNEQFSSVFTNALPNLSFSASPPRNELLYTSGFAFSPTKRK